MKKILLSFILTGFTLPVYAILPPDAAIIQVHDMQMINQQRFRIEEINDYNDVETEKARFQKKNTPSEPLIKRLFHKKHFVEQDGKILIKNDENSTD